MAEIHRHGRRKCRFWNKSSGQWASLIPGGEEESQGNSHANPSWIEGCSWLMSSRRTRNGQMGLKLANNRKLTGLLCPYLYWDLSAPQHPGSSCCTRRGGRCSGTTAGWEEVMYSVHVLSPTSICCCSQKNNSIPDVYFCIFADYLCCNSMCEMQRKPKTHKE